MGNTKHVKVCCVDHVLQVLFDSVLGANIFCGSREYGTFSVSCIYFTMNYAGIKKKNQCEITESRFVCLRKQTLQK